MAKAKAAGPRHGGPAGGEHRFTEMQMKVFLDRYALKGRRLAAGGQALVTDKQDPRRGQVVTVLEVRGQRCRVRLADGAEADLDRMALVPLLETSPVQMWDRVARAIASVEPTREGREHWARRFREALEGFKFVPGGRILAGAGSGKDLTYYNCYVLPSPHDSRKGIVKTLEQMIEIMARGGGVGINGSSLRPKGAYVRGVNGHSSGAVSWMEIYSDATGLIEQGGSRRGALMLMLAAWHPDIETFVTVKRDFSRFNNANLSVVVPDGFMEAVEKDADWDLVFPDTDDPDYRELWDGDLAAWLAAGKPVRVYKTIKARRLWDLIIESNWASGEPGVVFLERCNRLSNTWYFQKVISVNPCGEQPLPGWGVCLSGDTRVTTDRGLERLRDLWERQRRGQRVVIATQLNGPGTHLVYRPATVIHTGRRPVVAVELENGQRLKLTPDHRVYAGREGQAFEWIPAGQLTADHHVMIQHGSREIRFESEAADARKYQMFGWMSGDGWFTDRRTFGLTFGPQDDVTYETLVPVWRDFIGAQGGLQVQGNLVRCVTTQRVAAKERFKSYGFAETRGPQKRVPTCVWTAPADLQISYLQGLFSADGSVVKGSDHHRNAVELSSSSLDLLRDVQLLLLNLGIFSRIGWYEVRPRGRSQGRLTITGESCERFASLIGFPLAPYKETQLQIESDRLFRSRIAVRVRSVTEAGVEDVFDVTEPVTHSLIAEGMVVHNCNLGSLGLPAFVRDGELDWDLLADTTRVAVRFLDDVIDETRYIFEENRQMQMQARRVGLGTQGLAHLLIRLKLRYGSPEGNAFIEELYRRIMIEAYWASVEIAKEKGPFQAFDREKFLKGEFIRRLPADLQDAIAQHGIRNATLLTQAPTGTTSLLAGMSSGIEPVFRFKMRRQDRIGEHYLYDPLYEEWERANPGAERPDYFVEADDLTPEDHVTVQAIIQRYVDSSISKTVNAPNSHTVEDTRRVYELAYRLGCKGITYFRDGSRHGVLSEVKEEKKAGGSSAPEGAGAAAGNGVPAAAAAPPSETGGGPRQIALIPQVGGPRQLAESGAGINGAWGSIRPIDRPARLEGFTDARETPLGKLFLTLNVMDGHPIELFAQIGKAGSDVAAFTEAMARLVSLSLRCGVDPREVADQLIGIGGSRSVGFGAHRVRSVPDAIGQFLGEYLQRAEKSPPGGPEAAAATEGAGGRASPAAAPAAGDAAAPGTVAGKAAGGRLGGGSGARATGPGAKDLSLCPQCGVHSLAPVEGCATCLNCGYSEC